MKGKKKFLFDLFNNIELHYLKQFILNLNSIPFINKKVKLNNSDFKMINHFLINIFK